MTAPVLALAPVLTTNGTEAGARTGPVRDHGHRNHPSGETRMEKTGGEGRGRLTALPGCRCPLLPSCPATARPHPPGRRR
jgi:hypothetical protein